MHLSRMRRCMCSGCRRQSPAGQHQYPGLPFLGTQGSVCPGLPQPHPPTSGDSRPEPCVHHSLSGYPLQVRAASSGVRVIPDQVGGGGSTRPEGPDELLLASLLRWAPGGPPLPPACALPPPGSLPWVSPRGSGGSCSYVLPVTGSPVIITTLWYCL